MSNLNKLIKELCPNGVEYVNLGEVCTITKGKTPIQKAIPGEYPLVVTTSERKSCNTYQFDKSAVCIPLVSSRGHGVASLNHVYFQSGKFALGNILCAVVPNDENILSANYLYHYLEYKKDTLLVPLMKGGANVSLHIDDIQRVKIPLPPVEIQSKIIEILDKFVELSEVLSKELTARKKQYEYYRDLLLNFGVHGVGTSECEWRTLGEICKFYNGDRGKNYPSHSDYREKGIPFINAGDLETGIVNMQTCNYISEEKYNSMGGAKLRNGDIIYCLRGSIGKNGVFQGEQGTLASSLVAIRANDTVCGRYIYYLLNSSMELRQRIVKDNGAAQPNLSAQSVKNYLFPIPPIEEQKRIVSILDRFDKLCNDISEGLPAEIEARRKQYEYYRDKLLSFEEVKM